MKKFVSAALALCLAGAMTACAGGTSESTAEESSSASTESSSSEAAVDESSTSEAATDATVPVMTYDEYAAIEVQENERVPVTIQGYVQDKQSLYTDPETGLSNTSLYLQDQDGAYFAYRVQCSPEDYEKLTPGVCVQVTGDKVVWSGEYEIAEGCTFTFVDGADTYVAEPLDVTDLLGTDELEQHQNQYVSFTGLTVAPSTIKGDDTEYAFLYSDDGSGTREGNSDLYFNVEYNGEVYTFTVESDLCDSSTDVYKAVEGLEVGQTIDCQGFLYWYEGVNPHITSVTVAG